MSDTKLESIPFETFAPQLDTLLTAMFNKLDREWPVRFARHPGAKEIVVRTLKVSENTYRTIRFIAADTPETPARKREFALSIPPLARSILDSLFALVFLFGDLAQRAQWYFKAGWRELKEEHDRLAAAYTGDHDWTEWLKQHAKFVEDTRIKWGISESEAANPKKAIQYWPIPSKMIAYTKLQADRREYLSYLNDWFYKSLSQDAHLSWPGLVRRSFALEPFADADARGSVLTKAKSDAVTVAVVLLLAMLSELELEFKFELRERIKYVWSILNSTSDMSSELYEKFYQGYFGPASPVTDLVTPAGS